MHLWMFEPERCYPAELLRYIFVCLLKDENLLPQKFFEVDFPTVVARKIHNIK